MNLNGKKLGRVPAGVAVFMTTALVFSAPTSLTGQAGSSVHADVTFADVAPILQRSCQNCHRPDGVGPMSLVTYDEVRPWAPLIKYRTGIRDRMGAMPPWYVEKGIGIQDYKNDPSLSDEELAIIAAWADAGAPEGDPSRVPPPREFSDDKTWNIRPDFVVRTKSFTLPAFAPDHWVPMEAVEVDLPQDRYVAAVEMREVNNIDPEAARAAGLGGNYVIHHMLYSTQTPDGGSVTWPVHEVGRNADFFDPRAGRMLRANSQLSSTSVHLRGSSVEATGYLEIAFQFHPEGYEPSYRGGGGTTGDGLNIDLLPNTADQVHTAYQVLSEHTKIVAFEPHLHASGARMCLEAIWGSLYRETLSCVGYDHNWVRTYNFADHAAPLLPAGTILKLIAYMDTTPENENVYDSRNWQGAGNRTVANMFIDLGDRLTLTDEQFAREMAERRELLGVTKNDWVKGCPLCLAGVPVPAPVASTSTDF